MRNMMLGMAGGVMVTVVLFACSRMEPAAVAQHSLAAEPSGGPTMLMAHAPLPTGGQQIVVIDTEQRVIGSYHVTKDTGEITLKSIRNIRYDLLMEEFNGGEPKPRDIRALLEQR